MLICLSMDKWAIRGHFYSYVDLVRSLFNIGPCCLVIAVVPQIPWFLFFLFFMNPCDHQMKSIGLWLDSRLINISIEFKNVQNGLRMRKL